MPLPQLQLGAPESLDELARAIEKAVNRIITAMNRVEGLPLDAKRQTVRNVDDPGDSADAVNLRTLERRLGEERRVTSAAVTQSVTTTITGSSVRFIDITLTANHTVVAPAVAADTIVIYTFTQDGTGGWTVTWPAEFAQQYYVGTTADRSSVLTFRAQSGPVFQLLWSGAINRVNV